MRVWDCVLCAQHQAPRVLIMVALALLEQYKPKLMACKDFISVALLLQTAGNSVDDVNELMTTAFDAAGVGAVAEVSISTLRLLAQLPGQQHNHNPSASSPQIQQSTEATSVFSPVPWSTIRGNLNLNIEASLQASKPRPSNASPAAAPGVEGTPEPAGEPLPKQTTPHQLPATAHATPRSVVRRLGRTPNSQNCASFASPSAAPTPLRQAVLAAAAMAAASPSWESDAGTTPGRQVAKAATPSSNRTRGTTCSSPKLRASPFGSLSVGLFGSPVSATATGSPLSVLSGTPASRRSITAWRPSPGMGRKQSQLQARHTTRGSKLPAGVSPLLSAAAVRASRSAATRRRRSFASLGTATTARRGREPRGTSRLAREVTTGLFPSPAGRRVRRASAGAIGSPGLFHGLDSPTHSVASRSSQQGAAKTDPPQRRARSSLMQSLTTPLAAREAGVLHRVSRGSPASARDSPSAATVVHTPASDHPLVPGAESPPSSAHTPVAASERSNCENVCPSNGPENDGNCRKPTLKTLHTEATPSAVASGRRAGEVIELAMLSPVSRTPRRHSRLVDFISSPKYSCSKLRQLAGGTPGLKLRKAAVRGALQF